MKSEVLGYGFRHLMENGCIPEENEDEVDTPMEFLTDNEKEEKVKELVYEVETKMGVLFALYNEKYGTKLTNNSSDVQKSSSTQSSNTTHRRGNSFLNSFKSQNSIRSSGVEDELKKYLKEPILKIDDEEDFDILSWWKLNIQDFRLFQRWQSIYMDDLEDLLKDEEVIKEMKEALDKLKGANGKGSYQLVLSLKVLVERATELGFQSKKNKLLFINTLYKYSGVLFMASGGSDRDAKDALSKLLQIGMVAEYQSEFEILINRVTGISESLLKTFYISGLKSALQCAIFMSNPKTLNEAFSLARAMEARFTNLQLLEFLRSNPSTLGEAFFRARINEARFEDERSTIAIAKTNDSNTGVQVQYLEEITFHKSNKVKEIEAHVEATGHKKKATIEKEETIKETTDTLTSLQRKQLVDIFALFVVVSVAMLRFQYKEVYKAIFNNNDNVDMLYDGQSWKWPNEWVSKYFVLMLKQDIKLEREIEDKTVWVDNKKREVKFSVSRAWK
ncbi:zinc finger BED domain-containing protein RICESLEEPER 2 [Tanacetum coccineum]